MKLHFEFEVVFECATPVKNYTQVRQLFLKLWIYYWWSFCFHFV